MNEFKGTKGEWVLKQQGDANEYCILTEDMKWVSAFKLNGEQSDETQLANMALFAASKNLLATLIETDKDLCVLEVIMAQIEKINPLAEGMTNLVVKWRERNQKAINKALAK